MGKFLKECYLQKTNQFDALEVLQNSDNLKVSTKLQFRLDDGEDVKKDVALYTLAGNPDDEKKIGVLSNDDSKDIRTFLEAGWINTSLFECIVCRYDDKADENKRISVVIKVVDKPA